MINSRNKKTSTQELIVAVVLAVMAHILLTPLVAVLDESPLLWYTVTAVSALAVWAIQSAEEIKLWVTTFVITACLTLAFKLLPSASKVVVVILK